MSDVPPPNDNLQQTQQEVDGVVDQMKQNMSKVLEREENLQNLDDKTEALRDGADRFQTTSKRLKRKMWYRNMKFNVMLVVLVLIFIAVIIIIAAPWE
eukprot:Clim_evm4s209 gene=Clim_evmTU4s209